MPQANSSIKQLMVNKANSRIVLVTAVASFVIIFCLVASYTLFGQLTYQSRVISKKKTAYKQLQTDIVSIDSLLASYGEFSSVSPNILGGTPTGTGPQDGDNSKIVLDALPSKYDFPALATSLEAIVADKGVSIQSITGIDDQIAQSGTPSNSSPQPIEMPFEMTVSGNYDAIKAVADAFQRSIRPIQVQTMTISADGVDTLTLTVTAKTYYQPEKQLSIKQEVVK